MTSPSNVDGHRGKAEVTRMRENVFLQVSSRCRRISTRIAFEGFQAGMRGRMDFQTASLPTGVRTIRTFVRFDLREKEA